MLSFLKQDAFDTIFNPAFKEIETFYQSHISEEEPTYDQQIIATTSGLKYLSCIISKLVFFNPIYKKNPNARAIYNKIVQKFEKYSSVFFRKVYLIFSHRNKKHQQLIEQALIKYISQDQKSAESYISEGSNSLQLSISQIQNKKSNNISQSFYQSFVLGLESFVNSDSYENIENISTTQEIEDYLKGKNSKSELNEVYYKHLAPIKYPPVQQKNKIFKYACEVEVGINDSELIPQRKRYRAEGQGLNIAEAQRIAADKIIRRLFFRYPEILKRRKQSK